jgi:hypothetical protein
MKNNHCTNCGVELKGYLDKAKTQEIIAEWYESGELIYVLYER